MAPTLKSRDTRKARMKDEGGRMKKSDSSERRREKPKPENSKSSFIPHTSSLPSKRRFGQNFLVDRNVVDRIIAAVNPQTNETIIEIGPGRGALTSRLIESAAQVIAVELDRELASALRAKFASATNLEVIEADGLTVDYCALLTAATKARVVANLPYNVGTAILQRLIDQRKSIVDMTLMLQSEVVERITAEPGSSERGYLSVFVEAYCGTEKLFDVPPQAFRPTPKVWSSIVHLNVREQMAVKVNDEKFFWRVVSAGFAHPRKTILNNLRQAPEDIQEVLKKRGGASIVLCEAGIPPLRRAETFALEEWALLINAMG
jgi:16S rRNA (adenine1518-N6/adenine1519-N6)-dimethyltransferase